MNLQEPTSRQCETNEVVYMDDSKIGYAVWYPQMGGYVGRAIAVVDKVWNEYANGSCEGGCIDVYVWHDGEFPFDGEGGRDPVIVHHCDPMQFVTFGETLERINNSHRAEEA